MKINTRVYYVSGPYSSSTLIVVKDHGDKIEVRWAGEWDCSFMVERHEIRKKTFSDLTIERERYIIHT